MRRLEILFPKGGAVFGNIFRLMTRYYSISVASAQDCDFKLRHRVWPGAHLDINGEQVCNKQWDIVERRKSSTWRELSAILLALHSFSPLLAGSCEKWF